MANLRTAYPARLWARSDPIFMAMQVSRTSCATYLARWKSSASRRDRSRFTPKSKSATLRYFSKRVIRLTLPPPLHRSMSMSKTWTPHRLAHSNSAPGQSPRRKINPIGSAGPESQIHLEIFGGLPRSLRSREKGVAQRRGHLSWAIDSKAVHRLLHAVKNLRLIAALLLPEQTHGRIPGRILPLE
jgi:hypothetical protein